MVSISSLSACVHAYMNEMQKTFVASSRRRFRASTKLSASPKRRLHAWDRSIGRPLIANQPNRSVRPPRPKLDRTRRRRRSRNESKLTTIIRMDFSPLPTATNKANPFSCLGNLPKHFSDDFRLDHNTYFTGQSCHKVDGDCIALLIRVRT